MSQRKLIWAGIMKITIAKLFNIQNILLIILAENIISLFTILIIPRDISNTIVFGYSYTRLVVISVIFIYSLFLSILIWRSYQDDVWIHKAERVVDNLCKNETISHSLFLILLTCIIVSLGVFLSWIFVDKPYYTLLLRITPIVSIILLQSLHAVVFVFHKMTTEQRTTLKIKLFTTSVILSFSIVLSLITVYIQIRWKGINYLTEGTQYQRHQEMINQTAGNPWQYRILSDYLLEFIFFSLKMIGVHQPEVVGFIGLRLIQNILIFWVAAYYYLELGLSKMNSLFGLALIGLAFPPAYYNSDLQYNTYFDVVFYLMAGYVILKNKYFLVIPITVLAALNRETSGLIPIMLLADQLYHHQFKRKSFRAISYSLISLSLFALVFFGLRYVFGARDLIIPYGNQPGLELFRYNVEFPLTWIQLYKTIGLMPLFFLFTLRKLPTKLKVYFWVVIPLWIFIHFFYSIVAETRLFLVPYVLVILPGALIGVSKSLE